MSYDDAHAFVRQKRACIKPNLGFVQALREWEDSEDVQSRRKDVPLAEAPGVRSTVSKPILSRQQSKAEFAQAVLSLEELEVQKRPKSSNSEDKNKSESSTSSARAIDLKAPPPSRATRDMVASAIAKNLKAPPARGAARSAKAPNSNSTPP